MADPTNGASDTRKHPRDPDAASDLDQFCRLAQIVLAPEKAGKGASGVLRTLREAYPPTLFGQFRDRTGGIIRCQFGLFSGPEVNALAGRVNRTYVLGYFEGLQTTLTSLAMTILARPDLLADVGDARLECADVPLPAHLNFEHEPLTPRCPERRAFAEALAVAGLYYVMHHEFLHFYFGHIDFFIRNAKRPLILEAIRPARRGSRIDVFRHIAELEADGAAWRSLFTRHAIPAVTALCPEIRLSPAGWARVFFDAMFLVTGLWTILDRGADIPVWAWKSWNDYPAGIIRARALYRSPFADETFIATLPAESAGALRAGFARSYEDMSEIAALMPALGFYGRIAGHDWDDAVEQYRLNVVAPHVAEFHKLVDRYRPRPVKA